MPTLLVIAADASLAENVHACVPSGWVTRAPAAAAVEGAGPDSIARAFLEADRLLGNALPDAALVLGESDLSLAAAVSLVKLHVPVAAIEAGDLAARVADRALAATDQAGLVSFLEEIGS